ncbi:hypothetical protein GCM10011488_68520 [Steroidobacter agaridevorans]|nr:hypothetical protein GCM10011488_68520 [Steroidobacter agaridevorans]
MDCRLYELSAKDYLTEGRLGANSVAPSTDIHKTFIRIGMCDNATLSRLTPLLREVFENNGLVATPDLQSSDVQGWDSLGQVRLFFEIEREFSIRFSSTEINSLRNVGQIADVIESKMAGS